MTELLLLLLTPLVHRKSWNTSCHNRLARQERIDKLRAKEALFKKAASEVKGKTRFQMMKEAKIMQQAAMEANK